jgi:serine/threonine protein kinase
MTTRNLDDGERLITQGEEGDSIYIIRRGGCAVKMEVNGATHTVGALGPGEIVGEMAYLTGEKRNATVEAQGPLEVGRIDITDFERICGSSSKFRDYLTRVVSERLSTALLTSERMIGKYLIENPVGVGGFSIVYKGRHSELNLPVAIKMIKHQITMDPDVLQLLRNEAVTVAQLNHENILKVYDVEELYRTFFFIMEYVEGENLYFLLEGPDRMALKEKLDIFLQICAGVAHAHEHGVIHRDIKPGNVLIRSDNTVKIVDFGLACAPGTKEELVKGTAYYLSPEQIRRRPVNERTDIYSLGILGYELFTGKRACPEEGTNDALAWHLEKDIKDPLLVDPTLPDEIANAIIKAARRIPDARYRAVDQIMYELEPLADRLGLKTLKRAEESMHMAGLFLFYRGEYQSIIQKLVRDFGKELEKIGARLRGANFKDIQK